MATLFATAVFGFADATIASAGAEPAPPVTVSDFYPEDSNLSDCLGLVERPGCGSEARGGWGQTAVFAALALGLTVIFFNVVRGVRRNRASMAPDESASPLDTTSSK